GVLFEQPADLDRREPVESQREGLEEEEEPVADRRHGKEEDHAFRSRSPSRRLIPASRASISPSSVSWSYPFKCSRPWTRSLSISRDTGSPRRLACREA